MSKVGTDCKAGVKFDLVGHKATGRLRRAELFKQLLQLWHEDRPLYFSIRGTVRPMPSCSGTHQKALDINQLTELTKIGVKTMKRYQPKKQKSPVKAIREMCTECMGGRGTGQNYSKLIEECSSIDCPIYNFRFGKNPFHTQNLSEEERMRRANLARERFSKREALLN